MGARARPPDFAIVGAPKCGTTALYNYLADHPQVAMSGIKEPLFWCSDIERSARVSDRESYDALWNDIDSTQLRGEASPEYLRSRVAIPALLAERPDVRLIAMIRNPVDIVAAWHANLVFGSKEDVGDLEEAWRLQGCRAAGERLPPLCNEPGVLQYSEYAAIGDQLGRFIELVPAEQRLVIVYDDFAADTRREYERALAFLGLPLDGRSDFARVNPNITRRSRAISALQHALPRRLGPLLKPARSLAHALGIRPLVMLERLNVAFRPRKPLRPAFEAELIAELLPQIERVERVLGRDLSRWKVPRQPDQG